MPQVILSAVACKAHSCNTLGNTILCKKGRSSRKIDTTANDIASGELRPVGFPLHLAAKGLAIVAMVGPAFWLPAGQLLE